jgi:hypothetical protein
MTQQVKGAMMVGAVAIVFVLLDILLDVKTGMAGVFVLGVAGGLLVSNDMATPAKQ